MAENTIIEKAARPTSIQHAPAYITRQPLFITNPTVFTPQQWRLVAQEPITALCIRHIIREIVALEWEVTHEDSEVNEDMIKYLTGIFENADDGDGLDTWITRMLTDAMVLPVGGNSELAPDDVTGLIGGMYHIDGATLYPTYDTEIPFVQINPYNGLDRVYFQRGDIGRLILQTRVDLQRKMYQVAPVETAFPAIESLSRIYVYYLKQLSDTPMAGILDLMDMTADEATDWGVGYREMLDGIDPLKIPLLYGHTKPAKFLPMSRTPQDINMTENFKRFAEIVAAAFGLSIGDLRLFEHERVLAGVEASQRVTARSGVGFYAQALEDLINRSVLFSSRSGFKFRFILGMTGEDSAKAALGMQRVQMLMLATGNQPFLKPKDAQDQAQQWGIFDIDMTGVPTAPGLEGMGSSGLLPVDALAAINEGADAVIQMADEESVPAAINTINEAADDMEKFKSLVEKGSADRRLKIEKEFTVLMTKAFNRSWQPAYEHDIENLLEKISHLAPKMKSLVIVTKAEKTAGELLDEMLTDEDWYNLPDIMSEVSGILAKAYNEGSIETIKEIQQKGYKLGLVDTYNIPAAEEFSLRDPWTIQLLEEHGAELVTNVNKGTKFYIRQRLVSGVKQGWSNQQIIDDIKDNLFGLSKVQANKLSDARVKSIVNTEINWANSRATYDQFGNVGLLTKYWRTRGTDDVCPICMGNQALGAVDIDYEYDTVFDTTTLHPPAHPSTCHCYIDTDEDEIATFFADGGKYWLGGKFDRDLMAAGISETKKIIAANKKLTKHLPGLHDQMSHGGKNSTDVNKELLSSMPGLLRGELSYKFEDFGTDKSNDEEFAKDMVQALKDIAADYDNLKADRDVWANLPKDEKLEARRLSVLAKRELSKLEVQKHMPGKHDQHDHASSRAPRYDLNKLPPHKIAFGVKRFVKDSKAKEWKDSINELKDALGDDENKWVEFETEIMKSMPTGLWGAPEELGKRSRFETVGDAQHWLQQFSLVPVISNSMIDVRGAGYAYAGVVWGEDTTGEPIEAALMNVSDIDEDEIRSGKASIFGAKGNALHKSESSNSVMIALEVPSDVAKALGSEVNPIHLTMLYLGKGQEVTERLVNELSTAALKTNCFTVILNGEVCKLGDAVVVKVVRTMELMNLRRNIEDAVVQSELTWDKTHPEFSPHISLAYVGDMNVPDVHVPELAISFRVTCFVLFDADKRTKIYLAGQEPEQKSNNVFKIYADKVPSEYLKDFVVFLKNRTNGEPENIVVEDEMERYWKDFMSTLLVGGFDYFQGPTGTMKPLVRSSVGAVRGDNINEKAFYAGAGYSGVRDPEWDAPEGVESYNRAGLENIKRTGRFKVPKREDGNHHVTVDVQESSGGDPVVKTYDVTAFNNDELLEKWLQKLKAKKISDAGDYELSVSDIEADQTFVKHLAGRHDQQEHGRHKTNRGVQPVVKIDRKAVDTVDHQEVESHLKAGGTIQVTSTDGSLALIAVRDESLMLQKFNSATESAIGTDRVAGARPLARVDVGVALRAAADFTEPSSLRSSWNKLNKVDVREPMSKDQIVAQAQLSDFDKSGGKHTLALSEMVRSGILKEVDGKFVRSNLLPKPVKVSEPVTSGISRVASQAMPKKQLHAAVAEKINAVKQKLKDEKKKVGRQTKELKERTKLKSRTKAVRTKSKLVVKKKQNAKRSK